MDEQTGLSITTPVLCSDKVSEHADASLLEKVPRNRASVRLGSNQASSSPQLMTITEFATIVFKSPPNFSDPTLQSHFHELSTWQSGCSGFPLLFFTHPRNPLEVYLVTGWANVEEHEAWIQGERNQELLRIFAPYIDMEKIRMVHLGVDFEAMPRDAEAAIVVGRYDNDARCGASMGVELEGSNQSACVLVGRDLARDDGDVYVFRFVGVDEEIEVCGGTTPVEQWVLRRVDL